MIHSKNNSGFTILEVLVAVMITAMIMGPLFLWQTGVLSRTYQASGLLNRLFVGRNFLIQNHFQFLRETVAKKEEKNNDPAMTMNYELKALPAGTALSSFKNVVQEVVTLTWQDGKNKQVQRLVSFQHRPKESKQQ
ncbi:hypothetical protein Noda2021_00340 [Candidatus Dependentiae bacterium Noda2021]|nr:hypothetical protein Noda2021_00340 [Candidatus Dependentiae bacterium Noda2021]